MPNLEMYFVCYTDNEDKERWRLMEIDEDGKENQIARSTDEHETRDDSKSEIEKIVDYIQEYGNEMLNDIYDEN